MKKREPLHKIVWLMIVGSGLSRGAFYMAFPFLAIHLKEKYGAEITTIGWIIGFGPLMGAAVGFYGGYLSDIIGRRAILITSLIVWGLTQICFSFANSLLLFGILSAMNGILRSIAEPIIQAVISDRAQGDAKERAYHYRYFAINIGAAVGPLIGGWLLLSHPTLDFSLAGTSLILFAGAFAFQTRDHFHLAAKAEKPAGFWAVMKILARDRVLNHFVLASVICTVAYSQTEAALPIILSDIFGKDGAKIFGWTVAANGLTIILCQLSLNKLTKNFNTVRTVAVSSLVFGLGFVGFAFSSNIWWAYIASMVVLALGEILVFSNGYLLIDRLAPAHLRGTYHSAANLFVIGMAFGPAIGGWVLQHSNQQVLFMLAAGLLVICAGIYLRGDRVRSQLLTNSDYHFREAREEDIPQMKNIRDHVRENALVTMNIEITDYIQPLFQDGKGWVALRENKVVGFSCGRTKQKDVWALFIDSNHEGQGVGNHLMQLLEDWMFEQGLESIRLTTQPGTRAERLYRRRGWKIQPELEGKDAVFILKKT